MHPILENFIERPRSHKIAFWVISHGIILFLFWQYFYSAKGKELEKVQLKLESLTVQIATETRIVNNLEKYRREIASPNGLF